MEEADERLVAALIPSHADLRQLIDAHRGYELELEALSGRRWLSAEDQQRVRELKRTKLRGRDRIEAILAAHRGSDGGGALG